MQEFSDQNIVIIGGSYGIGEQIVKQALNAGAKGSLPVQKQTFMDERLPILESPEF